jgi:hypothetical protein
MKQNVLVASHSDTEVGQVLRVGRASRLPFSAALHQLSEGFGGHDCGFALRSGALNRASIQAVTSESSQATARAPRL